MYAGPYPTQAALHKAPQYISIYNSVLSTGLPNYLSARCSIPSGLNIPAWKLYLSAYHDDGIVDFLQFGWPVDYTRTFPPTTIHANHVKDKQLLGYAYNLNGAECDSSKKGDGDFTSTHYFSEAYADDYLVQVDNIPHLEAII